MAKALEAALPDAVVAQQQKSRREGKVLVDWGQNDAHKTTVNVYSLRAMDHPTVSTPVTWQEIEDAVKRMIATPPPGQRQTLEVAKLIDVIIRPKMVMSFV